ncbi:chromosome segregation protein SMC [Cytophagaceae bacterium ABcell3]|nr:chromosome segregation protein SMC [Cytophagaceae bacterium ABcell3]
MQLSKLEIKGFKSFGDRIVINFNEGITGIVGPNGCGKSNVVDAIRWVLGEQKTRALRSEKMENIIFNGTKTRKPTQMAEVSLTFNNTKNLLPTEYSQVTISRRYYRSGEGEYLLNGVTCRLKDITNLFLDTGVGSDSYAIIELKMVDDILNDKENSRRGLFEEAAGISKFKIRKKETIRKLEDTDKDLERVEDLLFEIGKNLKSLEKQAKQTEKYFRIKEEYKTASIQFARATVNQQQEALSALKKQFEKESDLRLSIQSKIAEKESEAEKLKSDLVNKEKLLSSRQKTLNEHVNKIRHYESEKKIKNERLNFLNEKLATVYEQIEQDRKSNERAEFSMRSLEKELEVQEKQFAEIEARIQIFQQEAEDQKQLTNTLREEVTVLNNQVRRKQEEVYQLNKSIEINNIQLSSLKQELEKTATDTSNNEGKLNDFAEKIKEKESLLAEKNAAFSSLQKQEEDIKEQIKNLEDHLTLIRDELNDTSRKTDARQNEFNLTKSMVENLEGFPDAIKFLKKQASWGKESLLLSDILTCDESYRIAFENYLEPYMNYYVVETPDQAYQAVNLLSDSAKGKANFFVLSYFDKYQSSPLLQYENCMAALDIAEYDSKYKGLVNYLLDNVYIVTRQQEKMPESEDSTFITQSGKIIKRRYSISGGSVGLFEGKRIGRAKNLENLEKEIKELKSKQEKTKTALKQKQSELEKLKQNSLSEQIDKLRREISQINEEYVTLKTRKEQFEELINTNTLRREDILEKINQLEESIKESSPKAQEEKSLLQDLEERLAEANQNLQAETDNQNKKTAKFNEENILYHQHQNKVNSTTQEISYKKNAFEASKARIEKNQEEAKKTDQEIKALLERADLNDDELVSMYQEKENIEQGVNEAEKEYYASRNDIEELENISRELRKQKESSDNLVQDIQGQLNENKLALTSVKERLSVEFNVDLDEVLKEEVSEELPPEQELREKVEKIKGQMDRIGPINPMAMEAYNEIQERFQFITTQKEDLTNAKKSLLDTISEIDQVAKETFMEAYNNIRENFILVFRSLFSEEDSCDLRLTNPDNPLDSSIEIIAKPKGKRPLTINQLSGGEKTLTAISLLFAIYLIKPAPFCIFDEVDAPLDDANIDKFNNIIRKFSADSQFIIVTHNKRTMASTDVIYGITMVEQGVSRVVPVDLRSLV